MNSFSSSRRPAIFYAIVMWVVSVVIAGFLIQLGASVIADVPLSTAPIHQEDFIDEAASDELSSQLEINASQQAEVAREITELTAEQGAAQQKYNAARAGFDNWIRARSATESQDQNPEVIARTQSLDALNEIQTDARQAVHTAQAELRNLSHEESNLQSQRRTLREAARAPYQKALQINTLKIFLIRLLILLPLLLVSAWLIARKRQSAYWPLFRGFIFFSVFAFFVELVPYLPSYGGYFRSIVGLIVAGVAGKYVIVAMRRYLEKKQTEESKTETERRQAISYEVALKKLSSQTCPSCDRSFANKKEEGADFCVHCGFCLYNKCSSCDTRDNSFHKYCGACGEAKSVVKISED